MGDFISTGNLAEDILAITAVHPLREEPLRAMVSMAGGTWQVVEDLLADGSVLSILYRNERYFFRRFGKLGCKASTGTSWQSWLVGTIEKFTLESCILEDGMPVRAALIVCEQAVYVCVRVNWGRKAQNFGQTPCMDRSNIRQVGWWLSNISGIWS